MPEPAYLDGGARFSPDKLGSDGRGRFRYRLWRRWNAGRPAVVFLMLNPSTANESKLDPTVRRCVGFAQAWGFGALEVANIFALRSTDPSALYEAGVDPVGPVNDFVLRDLAASHLVVCAWGVHGALRERGARVLEMLAGHRLHYLKMTKTGQPSHPLYLPKSLLPLPYPDTRRAA